MKRALVTGITGQDGSFLAELLLDKDYEVFGLKRRISSENFGQVKHLKNEIKFIEGDMCDQNSLYNAVKISNPDEIYNLAALTFVPATANQPLYTIDVNTKGVISLLEIVKNYNKNIKFFQASSSELFNGVPDIEVENEDTKFIPSSIYGCTKLFAHNAVKIYRDSYGLFASNGIMFNHESTRRSTIFAAHKIASSVAKIKCGFQEKLFLGDIKAKRDWGYAKDYVNAMYLILQHDKPDDFIISTGEMHSVEEFCNLAFSYVGLNYKDYIEIDEALIRPSDINTLRGDNTKIKNVLGWEPTTSFKELVAIMVANSMANVNEYDK